MKSKGLHLVDSSLAVASNDERDHSAHAFYRDVMVTLQRAEVPFLIGGAFALWRYSGVRRNTKDLDLFVKRSDWERLTDALEDAGFITELTYPHWLGKAVQREHFVDLIFNSGNGLSPVDELWFANAVSAKAYDLGVALCPPEEILWSKSFVMERERFDGADVAHLLLALGEVLDWRRLLARFGERWRVLLAHVVLFDFIYPDMSAKIPAWVRHDLLDRAKGAPAAVHRCQGTYLSRAQYLVDLDRWGYQDARLVDGTMTPTEVDAWTAAIED